MRWAQGWFQVSAQAPRRRLARAGVLTLRQKLGFTFLLGWRELYPWISMQMLPIIAFYAVAAVGQLDARLVHRDVRADDGVHR